MKVSLHLSTEEYSPICIEDSDMTTATETVVFYRSDTREPTKVFVDEVGFQQKMLSTEMINSASPEKRGDYRHLLLRKHQKSGAIDICKGVSGSLKASRAAYFPHVDEKNLLNTDPRYIYA